MIISLTGCGGGGGDNQQLPVINFSATPTVIMTGKSATLQWSVTGADKVESGDFTVSGPSSQVTVSPTSTKKYTLSATNSAGTITSSVTIVVVEQGKIAFVSSRSGQDQLYLMNADGTNVQLISTAGEGVQQPALSPDGTKIAYVSSVNGNADIFIVNADNSGTAQSVTTNAADDMQPCWSRDGSMLAWTREANSTYSYDTIIIKPVDGGTEQELVTDAHNPCWSPTTDQLAYTSLHPGTETIYLISSSGGVPTQVASLAQQSLAIDKLSWSKLGEIAFNSYDSSQSTIKGTIYSVDASANSAPIAIITNNFDNSGPAWSPSGNQLVFYTNRDGHYQIYISDADGNNQTRLLNSNSDDGVPVWSNSLRRLSFKK